MLMLMLLLLFCQNEQSGAFVLRKELLVGVNYFETRFSRILNTCFVGYSSTLV